MLGDTVNRASQSLADRRCVFYSLSALAISVVQGLGRKFILTPVKVENSSGNQV